MIRLHVSRAALRSFYERIFTWQPPRERFTARQQGAFLQRKTQGMETPIKIIPSAKFCQYLRFAYFCCGNRLTDTGIMS